MREMALGKPAKSNYLNKREALVDAGSVALETGLKASYQEKARREMGLPHYKIGARVYYKMSEVWQWIEQRKVIK